MNTPDLRVAFYRFRATLRRRWPGYVSIVLLIGLVGGVALGAIAAARRTQSAFPAYLHATHSTDLQVQIFNPASPSGGIAAPDLTATLASLPHVGRVASSPTLIITPIGSDGKPLASPAVQSDIVIVGSDRGAYFTSDRVTATVGRMADPGSRHEMVATAEAARLLGWHVGQSVAFDAYTVNQVISTHGAFFNEPPVSHFDATLVGLVVFSNQVVHDDVDRYPTEVLMTPALTNQLRRSRAFPTYTMRIDGGDRGVATVEQEIIRRLPAGSIYNFHVTSVAEGQVERASKPEAIALGVFGAIAVLAALLIAGQAISRAMWAQHEDLDVLRSVGAGPSTLVADAAIGLLGAVVVGSTLAVAVAVALSPLAHIGPASRVDPSSGIALDWTVLGAGFAALATGLGALTVALALGRSSRQRARRRAGTRTSRAAQWAAWSGLPEPAVSGFRFALGREGGRTAVPVRSVLLGAVLAVTVVVATVTFGNSLTNLDAHPALYGWNWSYAITPLGSNGNVPPVAGHLLARDPDVAAWTGYNYANFQFDGRTVPVLLSTAHAAVSPPILSGRRLHGDREVVLGSATLAALHKGVGDTVFVSYGSPADAPIYIPPTALRIVGTATLPAIGNSGNLHTSMGTGGLISQGIEPAAMQRALTQSDPNLNGPAIDVVQLRNSITPERGAVSLRQIAAEAARVMNDDPDSGGGSRYEVQGVQRPAEIVNYQSTGATPALLAAGLAAGAVVALGLTLAASVRRRRRDIALMKTLGYTQRQLRATIAWQATLAGVVGVVLGVPIGIALGRFLWILFARAIYAVPEPSVPWLEVLAIAAGTLVLANLAAAVPGRSASRTPTALALRAE